MFAYRQSYMTEENFKLLFNAYKKRLYAYVLAISHSPYVAEEITQEIFIKLWVCRETLDQVENLDAYIFTIASNKTLNHFRKATNDTKLIKELKNKMVPEQNTAEDHLAVGEHEKTLQQALLQLSPQRRIVYQLSRTEGLNHQQIASQLQLSKNTVKNHLVKALKFIRSHFGKYSSILIIMLFRFLT